MKQHIRIKKNPKSPPTVSRNDVDQAVANYLKKGGEIKVIEPLWLEEGDQFDRPSSH